MKQIFNRLLPLLLAMVMIFTATEVAFAEERSVDPYVAAKQKNDIANLIIQISNTYYYGADDENLLYRALCSAIDNGYFDYNKAVENMMDMLDDGYSEYYSPERYETMYTNITGEFYGIGVTITLSKDHVVVASVFPNSPAEASGILPYDTIVSVDDKDITGMSVADVASLIKREKGQRVKIGVVRDGKFISIDCYCDEVDQNPVTYEIMEDGKIGYIYISSFTVNLDEFITPILTEFREKDIKNIILDIRNNGGGELNAAISLAEHFVPSGVIAKLKYKNELYNQDVVVENTMTKSPYKMVLLVNENSASASELFAGAVKDRKAGTIIGTNTYGKGSMQSVYRLDTGSGIKYTIAEFHSPNDTRIHTVGVAPDFVVENSTYHITDEVFEPVDLEKNNNTSDGVHIKAIEQRLEALGCFEGEPDEVFDEATKEGLRILQMSRGIEITGNPDLYTLVALNDIIYDFEAVNDDQLAAAKNYLLNGKID